jgi:FkbM family methyltransferase
LSLKQIARDLVPLPLRNSIRLALGRHPIEYRRRWPELARIPLRRGDTVIDVGANVGDFTECALAYQPWLVIHAFEPIPEAFETLARRFGRYPGFRANQVALGTCLGQRRFHVSRYAEASSFFPLGQELLEGVYGLDYATEKSIDVTVEKLETYCDAQRIREIRLLKLDVQGAEVEVLEGAGAALGRTDYVYTEAQFRELYRGAPLFDETFRFLHRHGFELLCMASFRVDDAGELMECDMIFRRRTPTARRASEKA